MEAYGGLVDAFTNMEHVILESILDTVIFSYEFLQISVVIIGHIEY